MLNLFEEAKCRIYTFVQLTRYFFRVFCVLKDGQSEAYEIMMLSHRLEKGLINKSPKPNWGWDKAERLASLLKRNKTSFSYETGLGVLNSYIENKRSVPDELKKVDQFKKKYPLAKNQVEGGAKRISKEDLLNFNIHDVEKFILSRHSVREFNGIPIDRKNLEDAISLAMRCPSACNRQPYKVYFMTREQRNVATDTQDSSTASLYITGVIDAYSTSEMLDWIVSPSIFAAYLTLTLHAYGIGSCIYRKELVHKSDYNKKVISACKIPFNEQLILELRIGNYSDEVIFAYSNRLSVNQILQYNEEM